MKHIIYKVLIILGLILPGLSSCQRLNEIEDRLDQVEKTITDLKSAIYELQNAYNDSKIIKSVNSTSGENGEGWLFSFSDGTSIRILNGQDGKDGANDVTPYLKIDQDGFWAVSYDNGQSFVALLDSDGNKISAAGQDGCDGQDGADGISVRVVVNEDGFYAIQTYHMVSSDVVIDEVITPYTSITSQIISSITQDDMAHTITITMADSRTFTFSLRMIYPTSIAILSCIPMNLDMGSQAAIEFRVNPSNALLNWSEDSSKIVLDKVGSIASAPSRSSYVTSPTNYRLARVEQVYDDNTQEMKVGQYRAIIEDCIVSGNYDDMVALVINSTDEEGNDIQISSSVFEVRGDWFHDQRTGLPIVAINTPNSQPIVSKEDWITGANISIIDADMNIDYHGTTSIKGRGNATWAYAKKPYKVKLENKHPVLGNPKSKKWQFLAEYCDRSFLRTALMLELSKAAQIRHTVSYDFVELYLNGNYNGLYILTEQVEKDKNRINISDDGYIIEHDSYASSEPVWFTTDRNQYNFSFKYPDPDQDIATGDSNYNYIKGFMDSLETALYADNFTHETEGYRQYIDCESFAKWYIVMDLLGNWDPNWYYVLDHTGSKLEMYPCWDAEWCLGLADISNGTWVTERGVPMPFDRIVLHNYGYFYRLFQDPYFVNVVKTQWNDMKTRIPDAINNLQNIRTTIQYAAQHNFERWPTLGTYISAQLYTYDTWEEESDFIFTYFNQRMTWFDSYINSLQ